MQAFPPTHLVNSIKHEPSCKILYTQSLVALEAPKWKIDRNTHTHTHTHTRTHARTHARKKTMSAKPDRRHTGFYHGMLSTGLRREKTCLRRFANNKGADQPAHPRSLISAFVIRFLENTISKAYYKRNLYFLASLCS